MTTETILTPLDIFKVSRRHEDDLYLLARAIEQAVLKSPEVQAWKRDAERYRLIDRQSGAWAVLGSAYDLSSEYDGVANLSESIDAAMEQQI